VKKVFIAFALFFLTCSCASLSQQLSSSIPSGEYEELGQGTCKACSFLLLGVIPIAWKNRLTRAYQCALQSWNGDGLIDPTIKELWYYALLGNACCTEVSGTVIKKMH